MQKCKKSFKGMLCLVKNIFLHHLHKGLSVLTPQKRVLGKKTSPKKLRKVQPFMLINQYKLKTTTWIVVQCYTYFLLYTALSPCLYPFPSMKRNIFTSAQTMAYSDSYRLSRQLQTVKTFGYCQDRNISSR